MHSTFINYILHRSNFEVKCEVLKAVTTLMLLFRDVTRRQTATSHRSTLNVLRASFQPKDTAVCSSEPTGTLGVSIQNNIIDVSGNFSKFCDIFIPFYAQIHCMTRSSYNNRKHMLNKLRDTCYFTRAFNAILHTMLALTFIYC
jgi:hypothetical protein